MLIDVTRCVACYQCVVVVQRLHKKEEEGPPPKKRQPDFGKVCEVYQYEIGGLSQTISDSLDDDIKAELFWSAQKQADQNLQAQRQHLARLSRLEPEQAALELNRHCPYCGELLVPTLHTYEVLGRTRTSWIFADRHGCSAETKALAVQETQQQERQRVEAERQYQAMLNRAGLIGWLADCTFENF